MNADREIITKKGLMRRVWKRLDGKYTQRMVSEVLNEFYETVLDVIYEGAKLYVYDKFAIQANWIREQRNAYDPYHQKQQIVPGHYRLKITPYREVKEMLKDMAQEREEEQQNNN